MLSSTHMPFHLIGAGCGGTSLLAALLDSHSCIEVGFELFAYSHLMNTTFSDSYIDLHSSNRIHDYYKQFMYMAAQAPNCLFGNKLTSEQIAKAVDYKDNQHIFASNIPFNLFFDSSYRDLPVIFILRDGRSCVASKIKRGDHSFDEAARRWLYSIRMASYLRQSEMTCLFVKFEDLLFNPSEHLSSICDFLDLKYDPSMMNGTSNPKMHSRYHSVGLNRERACVPTYSADQLKVLAPGLIEFDYPI